jgi:hypothetical protein
MPTFHVLPTDKGGKFQDSIPDATCPADAKFIFKESIGQARPADAGRVDNVDLPAMGANSLGACYGSLQRLHVLPVWSGLQKHDDKMGGVVLGFVAKWIVCNDRLQLRYGTNEKVRAKVKMLLGLRLEQALKVAVRSRVALKN